MPAHQRVTDHDEVDQPQHLGQLAEQLSRGRDPDTADRAHGRSCRREVVPEEVGPAAVPAVEHGDVLLRNCGHRQVVDVGCADMTRIGSGWVHQERGLDPRQPGGAGGAFDVHAVEQSAEPGGADLAVGQAGGGRGRTGERSAGMELGGGLGHATTVPPTDRSRRRAGVPCGGRAGSSIGTRSSACWAQLNEQGHTGARFFVPATSDEPVITHECVVLGPRGRT